MPVSFHRVDPEEDGIAEEDETTEFSIRKTLHFHNYTNDFDGVYECRGEEKPDLDEILEAVRMDPFPSSKTVEVSAAYSVHFEEILGNLEPQLNANVSLASEGFKKRGALAIEGQDLSGKIKLRSLI